MLTPTVVYHLFPKHDNVIFDSDTSNNFIEFTTDELLKVCSKLKNNEAPGPGNIPPEIMKTLGQLKPEYILSVYNSVNRVEIARLVLMKKGNKPLDRPSSFRPMCLMDIEGNLFEHLLERFNSEIVRTGGLSPNQYGFRKVRQAVDAVIEVLNIANQALVQQELCIVLTIDV